MWKCFSTKHPSPARELLLCVYSRMMRSHERRALGVLLSLFSRFEPAPTDSYLYSGYGEARRLRSRIVGVVVVQRIDSYSCSYFCVYLVPLLLCTRPALLS